MNFSVHQASHIGNRKYNQDRVAYAYNNDALLLMVMDGMGGHLHGELAAGSAIETFVGSFARHAQPRIPDPQLFIADTMRDAHQRIMQFPGDPISGGLPGSTCVAALIQDGKLYCGHAGDSRLYLIRDGAVLARTSDHSLVYKWVELGKITDEEARVHPKRNQITNCLGGGVNMFHSELGKPVVMQFGDILLLGSDGLWGPFTDAELVEAFSMGPVDVVLEGLIVSALQREAGKSDNVTGLALRWAEDELAHDTTESVYHVLEIT